MSTTSPVHIVTDSTADIPPEMASRLGISIVPCQVYVDQAAYRDWVDLMPPACYEVLATCRSLPRTSQPPIADFVQVYHQLLGGNGGEVISIHLAANLAGTMNAAWAASQTLDDPSRVEVIDSGQLSMGLGWAVVKAAEWARAGASRTQVSQAVRALLPRVRVAAMIDSLDNLRKGGRISHVMAVLGTVLQVKPVLTIQGGNVEVLDRARTRTKAMQRLLDYVESWAPLDELAVLHTGAEDLAQWLAEGLADHIPRERILIAPAGAAVAAHLGLGAVGACAVGRATNGRGK